MSDQPGGVIEGDGIRIESSEETAEQMLAAVEPKKDEPTKFKAVKPEGEKEEKPKSAISKAASDLGKRGGKAAAKARAAQTEEAEAEDPAEKAPEKPKAPSGESDEPEEDDEDTDPEIRKSRAAERVKQATREAAEAKRERDRLKAENDELRRARQASPPAVAADRPPSRENIEAPKAPVLAEYIAKHEQYDDGLMAYLEARDAYRDSERARQEAAHKEREQVIGTVKTFQEAAREAVEADPEFWDKVPEIHDSTPLGQLIVRAGPKAPGILLYLGEHPKEYQRLSRLTDPYDLIDGLGAIKGKIEARNEDATAGNPSSEERPGSNPEISRARPPARPVAGAPHIASGDASKDPDENAPLSAFRQVDRKLKAVASGR